MSDVFSTTLTPEAESFADAVTRFCKRELGEDVLDRRAVTFSRELWGRMADLGLLEAAGADFEDAMLLVCAGVEQLGYYGFPGPVPHSIAAAAVTGPAREAILSATTIATIGGGDLIAWANMADIAYTIDGNALYAATTTGPVDTLGRTDVARVQIGDKLDQPAAAVLDRYHVAMAAYVGGVGRFLVDLAAEHARTRSQFGKTIGEFQAVAFPLAEIHMSLDAAQFITRAAAHSIDCHRDDAATLAAAARISAGEAALRAGFSAHQTLGAYGMLAEGPVGWLSRRVQEYATMRPSQRDASAALPLTAASALDPAAWPEAGAA